jgi:hypothetical protein
VVPFLSIAQYLPDPILETDPLLKCLFNIDRQKLTSVITRVSKAHLGEVIGSKRKELSARQFSLAVRQARISIMVPTKKVHFRSLFPPSLYQLRFYQFFWSTNSSLKIQ